MGNSNPIPGSHTHTQPFNASASFTNFATIHTLATPISLTFVQRLAVSEDVFLEVEKRRWGKMRQRAMMDLGGMVFGGSEKSSNILSSTRAGREGKGGIDAITLSNLSEFWDVVRRKFSGVEEVWIVGEGMEERVLEGDVDDCKGNPWGRSFDERSRERRSGDGNGIGNGNGNDNANGNANGTMMTRERRMSFESKIERAVSQLAQETGWKAPKWRYLGREDEEELSYSRFEFVEADSFPGVQKRKWQQISHDTTVAQEYDHRNKFRREEVC